MTALEVQGRVVAYLRETGEAKAPEIITKIGGAKVWEKHRGQLLAAKVIIAKGERRKCAVALVHHARKGGHARAGQALRGSSELHAWGDSNLYLRRDGERLLMSIEHRGGLVDGPRARARRANRRPHGARQ